MASISAGSSRPASTSASAGPNSDDNSKEQGKDTTNPSLPSQNKPKGRPSSEEIEAKRRQRAEKREREAQEKAEREKAGIVGVGSDGKAPFAPRAWSDVKGVGNGSVASGKRKIKIVSWNLLAQGLVRRKLFPTSDCLRWKEREPGLTSELLSHNWDVAAFQEVDRIEDHGASLKRAGKDYVYAKGYREKQHGLMIAWRRQQKEAQDGDKTQKATFSKVAEEIIYFDREPVASDEGARRRLALSRVTRNIALFVALRIDGGSKSNDGLILATTHLFWHPMHSYERVRQSGILKRKLAQWRADRPDMHDWPLVLAGDFNDQPHSATYHLMTGEALTQHCLEEVRESTVVHKSVDELKDQSAAEARAADNADDTSRESEAVNASDAHEPSSGEQTSNEDDENEEEENEDNGGEDGEGADDQMLKNCRAATEADGLLSFAELVQLHDLSRSLPAVYGPASTTASASDNLIGHRIQQPLFSAYAAHYDNLESSQEGNFFGSRQRGRERHDDPEWKPGMPNVHTGPSKEPMYTLYSSLFALTLDYIFLFPSKSQPSKTAGDEDLSNQDISQTDLPDDISKLSLSSDVPTVTALLPTHRTDVLDPGVPRKGVCASDHVVIGAEFLL